jgi:Zn ribbon nucleic-acid-binding protein
VILKLAPVWLDYRNRLGALVVAIVGFVLWLDGLDEAARRVLGGDGPVHLLEAGWTTGAIAALVWYAAFRCPFCAKHFHWTLWVVNPVADACLHCGFRKWRDPHAARALRR